MNSMPHMHIGRASRPVGAIAVAGYVLPFLAGVASGTSPPATQPGETDPHRILQAMVRRAVDRVAPAVVTIETVGGVSTGAPEQTWEPTTRSSPGRPGKSPGRGPLPAPPQPPSAFQVAAGPTTGVVFSPDGLILTSSFHFARDPVLITVRLADGSRYPAEFLAKDEIRRLAMLRIRASGLTVPTWADEDRVRVGQWTVAIGRGLGGDEAVVSVGIVSGLNRMGGNAIQTDAKLSPINYGGPLIDIEGNVIGLIVPMSYMPGELAGVEQYDCGIGFAIPAGQADLAGKRLGQKISTRRGFLGIHLGSEGGAGLRILRIADRSPAQTAGLQVGDELVALDEIPIANYPDMQRRLAFRAAGDLIAITVRREGRVVHTDATLAAWGATEHSPRPELPAEDPPR